MGAAHGRGSSAHEQRRLSAVCLFMLHLRSGIGGLRDCGHIRLLLKEIRDSARIGPARVQCPLQGRALYEASCGVSPVLPRAPDPPTRRRWACAAGTVPGHRHFLRERAPVPHGAGPFSRCPLAPASQGRPHDGGHSSRSRHALRFTFTRRRYFEGLLTVTRTSFERGRT
jgi:hypothetical protein